MRSTTQLLSAITDQQIDLNDFASNDGYLFVRDGVGVDHRGAMGLEQARHRALAAADASCEAQP